MNTNDNVDILLVVWGKKYIDDFFQFSLPSLLAPHNLAALVNTYKTRFVFLAREQDIKLFEEHPAYQALQSLCEVQFIFIDDLIVFGHYATTITLAYERAILQAGNQMLNTYFILLTSDLIMADGSMRGLARCLEEGYSAVYAGSIQVIKEKIQPYLVNKLKSNSLAMSVPPRELLDESFQHLHPVVFSNLSTQAFVHNYRAHRFFYRLNHQLMACRYYLLHPLCIKPETTHFTIASSFDYSFVPEMCPSNHIAVLNDSDDFLIVEIQDKEHELDQINRGNYDISKLAHGLAEWTTHFHRQHIQHTFYFHTRDISEEDKTKIEKGMNPFIESVATALENHNVQPVRNHPYWINNIKAFNKQREILKNTPDTAYPDLSVLSDSNLAKKMYYTCFGVPPKVRRWHYRWREYRDVMNALESIELADPDNTAVFYDSYQLDFMWYRNWMEKELNISHHYHMKNMLSDETKRNELQNRKFKSIVYIIKLNDLETINDSLNHLNCLLEKNGKCYVLICNDKHCYSLLKQDFWGHLAHNMIAMTSAKYRVDEIDVIHSNTTMLGAMAITRINKLFSHSRRLRFLSYMTVGAFASLYCLVRNCLPIFSKTQSGHCTNVLLTLTPEIDQSAA